LHLGKPIVKNTTGKLHDLHKTIYTDENDFSNRAWRLKG